MIENNGRRQLIKLSDTVYFTQLSSSPPPPSRFLFVCFTEPNMITISTCNLHCTISERKSGALGERVVLGSFRVAQLTVS